MGFVRFVFECFSNALGYMVGDVYHSPEVHSKATHGTISGVLFVVASFLLIKFCCLDYEGYPKRRGGILLSIVVAAIITVIYLAFVYWFGYRVP